MMKTNAFRAAVASVGLPAPRARALRRARNMNEISIVFTHDASRPQFGVQLGTIFEAGTRRRSREAGRDCDRGRAVACVDVLVKRAVQPGVASPSRGDCILPVAAPPTRTTLRSCATKPPLSRLRNDFVDGCAVKVEVVMSFARRRRWPGLVVTITEVRWP